MSQSHRRNLVALAESIPKAERMKMLMAIPETEFHLHLRSLYQAMQPNYLIEVTHGIQELGKDLVIVKKDAFRTDVIGVVVKMGDVSGGTLKEVDDISGRIKVATKSDERKVTEIESQIEQAIEHPATLKTVFATLPIDQVYVVVAGKLSGNARIRLEAKVNGKSVTLFDIARLVEDFTQHYPQVFVHGDVINFIDDQLEKLEKNKWMGGETKKLTDYYVEPIVATTELPTDLESVATLVNRRKLPISSLKSVMNTKEKLILVGDPGTGKSAALAWIAIDILRKASAQATQLAMDDPMPIPLHVQASEVLSVESADQLFKNHCSFKDADKHFRVHVLLVDGLDEVSKADRASVMEKADSFANEMGCALILTSRKVDAIEAAPTSFTRYDLLPFDLQRAIQLFTNWSSDRKKLDALKDGLEKIRSQIPVIPLSLMLLIELAERSEEIPATVPELYERYMQAVLGKDDRAKGIEVLFDYDVKRKFLASLAYDEFYQKQRFEIEHDELMSYAKKYAEKYNATAEYVSQFISEIERAGVLDIGESVEFKHRSFLDYFVAHSIMEYRDELDVDITQLITQLYYDDVWSDVAFFYIGVNKRIGEKLLQSLLSYPADNLTTLVDKFMIGRLLQAGWHSTAANKSVGVAGGFSTLPDIRDRLTKLCEATGGKVSMLFADIMIHGLSSYSYRTSFLLVALKELLVKQLASNTADDLNSALVVMTTVSPLLEDSEIQEYTQSFLKSLDEVAEVSVADKARMLFLLSRAQGNDNATRAFIDKRLQKMLKKYPHILTTLNPTPPSTKRMTAKRRTKK